MFGRFHVAYSAVLALLLGSVVVQAQVKTVTLTPANAEAEVGQQVKLTVSGLDTDGKVVEQKAMLWAAIPGDLAAASNDGVISLFAPGEVTVIAVVGGKLGRATIRVKPARVAKVEIEKLGAALVAGGSLKLSAKVIGANGDPRSDVALNWSSSNPAVATIDVAGFVTGIAPGKTKLRAKADDVSGELAIEVIKSNVRNIALTPKSSSVRTGDVVRFGALAKDTSGSEWKNAAVRWAVSGEGALIASDGGFVAERLPAQRALCLGRAPIRRTHLFQRHQLRHLDYEAGQGQADWFDDCAGRVASCSTPWFSLN